MEKQYLAISIGPVFNTIRQARKTRELWATSFLFSRLMQLLIEQLLPKGLTILSPSTEELNKDKLFGAGVFPDRLFAEASGIQKNQIDTSIKEAIHLLAKEVLPENQMDDSEIGIAISFWEKYFRVVYLLKKLDDSVEKSIVLKLNNYLDTLELQPQYFEVEPEPNYLLLFLNRLYDTPFKKHLEELGNYNGLLAGKALFPSTADIASIELFQKSPEEYNSLRSAILVKTKEGIDDNLEAFYEELFFQNNYRTLSNFAKEYHKYFCIVHVDGDSFGRTIAALKNEDLVQFSKDLAQFAQEAAGIIDKYGGKPVYIGGDDLLFFTPIRSEKGTVFNLIEELDKAFASYQFIEKPTLSYGLTISYYKYPLFEAHFQSYQQLGRAKNYERPDPETNSNKKEKDAIAFRLLKHSSSYFDGLIGKEDLSYVIGFTKTVEALPDLFLSSIMYKLNTLQPAIQAMIKEGKVNRERLDFLFENYFNESIHKQNERILETVKPLMFQLLKKCDPASMDSIEAGLKNLYSLLRLLDFITPKIQQNEPAAVR